MHDEQILSDREDHPVIRRGDTVRHPSHPWSAAVHSLLNHLYAVGFDRAPRVIGTDGGWDVLSYIEGESGPDGWAKVVEEDGLRAAARLLREYHDAVAEWQPTEPPVWYDGRAGTGGEGEIVCHGDYGPWNIVWQGTTTVGLLDWEYARIAPASHDVYYALQYVAPFRSDEECVKWLRYPGAPDRRRRTEIFAAAYGWDSLGNVVDEVIAVQRQTLASVRQLAAQGRRRQVEALANGLAKTVEREITSAERNRRLFT